MEEEIRAQGGTGVQGARAAAPSLVGGTEREQGRKLAFAATQAASCPGRALDWAVGEIREMIPELQHTNKGNYNLMEGGSRTHLCTN